jgi:hypothetical protein
MISETEAAQFFEGARLSSDRRLRMAYSICQAEGGYQTLSADPANYHPENRQLIGTKFGVSFYWFYQYFVKSKPELREVFRDPDAVRQAWIHLPLPVCASYAYWIYGQRSEITDVTAFYVSYYRPALLSKREAWPSLDIFKRRAGESQVEKAQKFYRELENQDLALLTIDSIIAHVKLLIMTADRLANTATADRGANGVYSALDLLYGVELYDALTT